MLGLASMAAVVVEGDLGDRSLFARQTKGLGNRADVAAAEAENYASQAAVALAAAARFPAVAVQVRYAREQDEDIVLGGFSVALPVFERGQGDQAKALARRERALVELEARRAALSVEIEGKSAVFAAAVAAVLVLEKEALPRIEENERMAMESYKAGKIGLDTFLRVRRETVETRREAMDRLLEAALAGVNMWTALGARR